MNRNHLTDREQQEYLLQDRTPNMLHHLAECSQCRDAVDRLQQAIGMFRSTAVEYSAQSLASRPYSSLATDRNQGRGWSMRWAFAAVVPLLLLLLALLPLHVTSPSPVRPAAQLSDDALLDQVDEQLSVAVPSSMESLTHLVSADGGSERDAGSATPNVRRKAIAQSN